MSITGRRRLVAALIVAVILAAAVTLVISHDPTQQVKKTFARITTAIDGADAAGVINELHPDYDVTAQWPTLFDKGEGASALGSGAEDPRSLAKRGLAMVFLMHMQNHLRMLSTIHQVTVRPDGTAEAEVSIEVGAAEGGGLLVDALQRHRFVLKRTSWLFGTMKILSHDHIDVALHQ